MENEKVLYIAEIPYETGEIHFRYSCRLSEDGTKWIRDGLFTAVSYTHLRAHET